ncbi:MAG: MFS transporter [Parachlamydiales bacterium]|nr:MFS transporter [Parachlamydiales bacterium]
MKFSLKIFGICFSVFLTTLDFSIVNTTLATIQRQLDCSFVQLIWIMTIFIIVVATLTVTMGRIGNLFGNKRTLTIGLVFFGVGSLLSGSAPSIEELLLGRAFQGLGTSIILPTSLSLLIHAFETKKNKMALKLWTLALAMGVLLGPILSSIIVTTLSWRWIFFNNLPWVLLSLLFVRTLTKEHKHHQKRHLDGIGVLLIGLMLISLCLILIQGPSWGWSSWNTLSCTAVLIISAVLLYFNEKSVDDPLINFHHVHSSVAFCSFCVGGITWSTFFLLPLYLQSIYHLNPWHVMLVLSVVTVPFFVISRLKIHIIQKLTSTKILLCGLVSLGASAVIQAFFQEDTHIFILLIACFLFGIGWGLTFNSALEIPQRVSETLKTVRGMGRALFLAMCATLFLQMHQNALEFGLYDSHVTLNSDQIENIKSLMSDPDLMKQQLDQYGVVDGQALITLFRTSFLEAYQGAMGFLAMVSLATILSVVLSQMHARAYAYKMRFKN